jgi:hypothetical protein
MKLFITDKSMNDIAYKQLKTLMSCCKSYTAPFSFHFVPDIREEAVKIVMAGGKVSRYCYCREKLNGVMKGWGKK